MNLYQAEAGECYVQTRWIDTIGNKDFQTNDTYKYGNGYYCIYGASISELKSSSTCYIAYTKNGTDPKINFNSSNGDVTPQSNTFIKKVPYYFDSSDHSKGQFFDYTFVYNEGIRNCFYYNFEATGVNESIKANFVVVDIVDGRWWCNNFGSVQEKTVNICYYTPLSSPANFNVSITSNNIDDVLAGSISISKYSSSYGWIDAVGNNKCYLTGVSINQGSKSINLNDTTAGDLNFSTAGKSLQGFSASGLITLKYKIAYKITFGNTTKTFTSNELSFSFNVIEDKGFLYIKVANNFKKGKVYIKDKASGTWKEADNVYIKVNGIWKESIL